MKLRRLVKKYIYRFSDKYLIPCNILLTSLIILLKVLELILYVALGCAPSLRVYQSGDECGSMDFSRLSLCETLERCELWQEYCEHTKPRPKIEYVSFEDRRFYYQGGFREWTVWNREENSFEEDPETNLQYVNVSGVTSIDYLPSKINEMLCNAFDPNKQTYIFELNSEVGVDCNNNNNNLPKLEVSCFDDPELVKSNEIKKCLFFLFLVLFLSLLYYKRLYCKKVFVIHFHLPIPRHLYRLCRLLSIS